MPAMAPITVKKYDGTTDISYNTLSQSNGDGTFAKWRQDTGNANPPAMRPQFWFKAADLPNGRRLVEFVYVAPFFYTDTTTSQVVISDKAVTFRNGQWKIPQSLPAAFVNEAVAQCHNLMGSVTIRDAAVAQTSFV